PALDLIDKGRLVHGDMWPKNILIQKHGGNYRISGIIDSERAYWGDEASEWVHYLTDISQSFWDGYGALFCPDGKEERRQFYYGMHYVMATIEEKLRNNIHPEWSLGCLAKLNREISP
ncbi:MAG TPA: phosphotransferase, partial [Oscillospiraceae bacterium]|nr:phosphotransferase [Oscillospiraceae bacterium]